MLCGKCNFVSVTPIRVCRRAPVISHFPFADDTLLFFKATEEQALCVKNTLESICNVYGTVVEPHEVLYPF
jgi:hypothetical protein